MKKTRFVALSTVLLVAGALTLASCGTSPDQANGLEGTPPAFTGDGGRGTRMAVLVPDAIGLDEEQDYLPGLVQSVMVDNFSRFSAISVLDRVTLETVLAETESGIYQTEEDFGQLGEIANVDYVMTGSITRTGTGHVLQVQIVGTGRDNIGITRASFMGTPTVEQMGNFTGPRQASMELLTQMGVNLTADARRELSGAASTDNIEAQTSLAQGVAAQRGGDEVLALFHFAMAANSDRVLTEAASRQNVLVSEISSGNMGANILNDIAWRNEWINRLRETEEFFAANPPPFNIVYSTNINHVSTDFARETAVLRTGPVRAIAADPRFFLAIDNVMRTVRDGLLATGRAQVWGLHQWPSQSVAVPIANLARNSQVELELLNSNGQSLGRQTINIRFGVELSGGNFMSVNALDGGNIDFRGVNAHLITEGMSLRINSLGGIPAEAASKERRVSFLTVAEHNRIPRVWANGLDIPSLQRFDISGGTATLRRDARVPQTFIVPAGIRRVNFPANAPASWDETTNVMFPNGIEIIYLGAFSEMFPNVRSLTIPDSATTLHLGTMSTRVRRITVPANLEVQATRVRRDGMDVATGAVTFRDEYIRGGRREGTYIHNHARATLAAVMGGTDGSWRLER